MKYILIIIFLPLFCGITTKAVAQQAGVKTNLAGWATCKPRSGNRLESKVHIGYVWLLQSISVR